MFGSRVRFLWLIATLGIATAPDLAAAPAAPVASAAATLDADDPIQAEKILRPVAEAGDADAQHLLGYLYDLGLGVPLDFAQGNAWQEKAARQGHYWAQLYLGWKVRLGAGVGSPDAKRAGELQAVLYARAEPPRVVPAGWLKAVGQNFTPNYPRAAKWLRQRAEADDPAAAFALAELHYLGLAEGRPNPTEHIRWLQVSATGNYAPALARLKLYHLVGLLVPEDPALARRYRERAAAAGDAASQYELGRAYARGQDGLAKNRTLARDWYAKAAAADYLPAINALADLLRQDGPGVPMDLPGARQWSRRAADLGDPEGLSDLARMLREGHGGDRDREGAERLFRQAAEKKYAYAIFMVGWMLVYDTQPPDHQAARGWFEQAAAAGNTGAMKELGWLYTKGQGVAPDPAAAFLWYEKAAREGDAWAQDRVAQALLQGTGIERDPEEALTWLKLAIAQNFAPAMTQLADLLRRGDDGVPKNQAEAFKLYRQAAEERQNAYGAHMVGWMITYGEAGPVDYAEARRWFEQAVKGNYTTALSEIGLQYAEGRGTTVDQAEAYTWFMRAAEQGNAWAQNRVGWMLLQGEGIAVDAAAAIPWFRRAAEQNNTYALINLGHCLERGAGTDRDLQQALACYRKAIAAGQPAGLANMARLSLELPDDEQRTLFREITPLIMDRAAQATEWELGPFAGVLLHNQNRLGDRELGRELLDRAEAARQRAATPPRPKVSIKLN